MKFQRITKGRECPVCKGSEAYRIRRAGMSVKVVCRLFNLRPHYCPNCDTFFLGPRHTKDLSIRQPLGPASNHQQGGNLPQAGSLPH